MSNELEKEPAVTIDRERSIVSLAFDQFDDWKAWAGKQLDAMSDTGPGRELADWWDAASTIDHIGLYGLVNDSIEWCERRAARSKWTPEPPTQQGTYWHWNGDRDCAPNPMFVMWSGFSGKCFVSMGQLGLTHAIDCDEFGGWWMPLPDPEMPDAETVAQHEAAASA